MAEPPRLEVLLSASEVREAVGRLADAVAPTLDDETVVVCLLTGGAWFCTDLMRALATRDRHPLFDAMWLASYGDARTSGGAVEVRAGLQRPVTGREALIVDDVLESGLSLANAVGLVKAAGATRVRTAVFARKPWASGARAEPDFVAWEAPARFLAGYGMDVTGRYRGLAQVVAAD